MIVRKQLDFPPAIAKAFVKDMTEYFNEENGHKRNAIAVRQLQALKEFQSPRERPLLLSDVKRMFVHFRNTN